jgi:hypothetical protein
MDNVSNIRIDTLDRRLEDPLEIKGKSQHMTLLELVRPQPDWMKALEVAFTRPPGVPERRAGEDPFETKPEADRPRRIADELVWLRQAMDEPEGNGLTPLPQSAAVAIWDTEDACVDRLCKLRDRRVLDAAGFLLHESDDPNDLL